MMCDCAVETMFFSYLERVHGSLVMFSFKEVHASFSEKRLERHVYLPWVLLELSSPYGELVPQVWYLLDYHQKCPFLRRRYGHMLRRKRCRVDRVGHLKIVEPHVTPF